MVPWELLASAQVPDGGGELCLHRRGSEFSIRADGRELMNSRAHSSEEALSELACARIAARPRTRVLVGGLGMGFTLRAALSLLAKDAQLVVAELLPAVVAWNRSYLGHLAGHPLSDARVSVRELDVAELVRSERAGYDAILLDVDNGPEGFTRAANDRLYDTRGLAAARAALRPRGVLAVWSARGDRAFGARLARSRFEVEERTHKARGERGGSRHTIWVATKSASTRS